jgi:hypothetical protein
MPYTAKDSPYAPGPNGETSHAAAQHADEKREQKRHGSILKLLLPPWPATPTIKCMRLLTVGRISSV